MKNHYVILGVLPSADIIVIRAAYKALVQRYHPDKFVGNKKEAEEHVKALNEAYETLSNPEKRQAYDSTLNEKFQNADDYFSEEKSTQEPSYDPLEESWKNAVEYYPDLNAIAERLNKISWHLGYSFKALLLENKQFPSRHLIANEMRKEFLKTYFGSNPEIIAFAEHLIQHGLKAAARELNKVIRVLGDSTAPEIIIRKIEQQHSIFYEATNTPEEKNDDTEPLNISLTVGFIFIMLLFLIITLPR